MTNPKAQTFPELTDAIEEFKAHHVSELGTMKSALDDANTKIAALLVGGGASNDNAAPKNDVAAKTALGQFVKSGNHEALGALAPKAAHQIGVEEDGGYIVPPHLDTTILEAQRDLSPFRRLARVVSTGANVYQQPFNLGGTGSGWVGETDPRPETDTSKLTLLEFPAGEVYANPAVTQRMLDDAPINYIGQFVVDEIAKQFDGQEAQAFLTGNGVNKPKGLLTYSTAATSDATRPLGTLQHVLSGATASVNYEAVIDLIYATKAGYRRKGAFLMNSRTQGAFAKIKDGNGNFMLQQSVALGIPSTIFGFPVETDELMPDIAAGSTPVAFGDFSSGYLINDPLALSCCATRTRRSLSSSFTPPSASVVGCSIATPSSCSRSVSQLRKPIHFRNTGGADVGVTHALSCQRPVGLQSVGSRVGGPGISTWASLPFQ